MEQRREADFRKAAEITFAVLTGASLLGSLIAMLWWSAGWVTPMWLTLLRCAAAVTGLTLWDRKDAGFRILAVYLAMIFLKLLIPTPEKLFEQKVSETLFNGLWAFAACYSLGHILKPRGTELFLKIFLGCWIFCMACLSGISVYAAWTDGRIWNIGQGAYWGLGIVSGEGSSRLKMFFDSNTSGILFSIATMAAVLCMAVYKARWQKALCFLALLPNWTALALTDSRNAQISAAVGIGAAVGILALGKAARKDRKTSVRWITAAGAALITAVICVLLLLGTVFAFNGAKTAAGGLVPGAAAESTVQASIEPDTVPASIGEKIQIKVDVTTKKKVTGYQWQYSQDDGEWINLETATAKKSKLKITVRAATYRTKFRCVVTTKSGTAVSNEVSIVKPFTVTLTARTRKSAGGDTVTLIAETDGAKKPLQYQWQVSENGDESWTNILKGGQEATLTVEVREERRYRCIVTAGNGVVTSWSKTIEKPSGTAVKTRTLEGNDLLTGRTEIWKQTLRYLGDHPETLLTGRSVCEPLKDTGIMRNENVETEHCHNAFLQILMESGIPGLLLILAFLALTGRRAGRLAADADQPLLLRLIPAALAALWAGELAECIVRMSNVHVPTLAILALYSGIIAAAGKKTVKGKK